MRTVLTLIQAICIVTPPLVTCIPMDPTLRWILIAVAAGGLIVTTVIKEVIREREATRRKQKLDQYIEKLTKGLSRLSRMLLIAIAAGGFIMAIVLIGNVTIRRQKELIRRTEQLSQRVEVLEETRDTLFSIRGTPVMEAPREISPAPIPTPSREIQIKAPQDGSQVPWRPYVEGTVADPNATVWVIVHPMGVSSYWIQPSVTVKEDGTWKVQLYLGRAEDIDVGKHFEILAIANPKERLSEAKVLGRWPDAQWKSQVIEVTRK